MLIFAVTSHDCGSHEERSTGRHAAVSEHEPEALGACLVDPRARANAPVSVASRDHGVDAAPGFVFEPLGYVVDAVRHPHDERFPEWGESPYFSVKIAKHTTLMVTIQAFEVPRFIAGKRLALGRLTVIDATSVQPQARKPLVEFARQFHCLPVAIVLDLPERVCHERNRDRPGRDFGPHVVRNQKAQLRQSFRGLRKEGFRHPASQQDGIEWWTDMSASSGCWPWRASRLTPGYDCQADAASSFAVRSHLVQIACG